MDDKASANGHFGDGPSPDRSGEYSVVRKIGEGGMGAVFLAEDTTLGRRVALKYLSAALEADETARERFIVEAKMAAAIDHPFVGKIYGIGELEGKKFIAMEYVEGQDLKQVLVEGAIPLRKALQVAVEIADALVEAHKRGIVHRDLKPANVILTPQGHIKILDFGLAKHIPVAEDGEAGGGIDADQTSAGSIIGTPNYMSPEQLNGLPVGPQSDIFSFGILFYQVLTGHHPFQREGNWGTVAAILSDPPAPPSQHIPEIPPTLGEILERMLAKETRSRYASAADLLTDLRSFQDAPWIVSVAKREDDLDSIAVLPFADLSAEQDQQYFCDGLAEELISGLTRLEGLLVAARTSAFRFRGRDLDIREIGKQLKVNTVLEGSVRKAGQRVRITVLMVNSEDGYQLWSERYEGSVDDVFEIQDRISFAVIDKLKVTLLQTGDAPNVPPTDSVEAYEIYLRGRFHWNKRSEEDLNRSVDLFEEALEVDPDFPLALSGLADAYVIMGVYGMAPPSEVMPKARRAAEDALQLDPRLAEALVSRGAIRSTYDWDWEAQADFQAAIRINPQYATAHQWYATNYLMPLGHFEEARLSLERALHLDPLSTPVQATRGLLHYLERDFRKAVRQYLGILENEPDFSLAHFFLGQAYAETGLFDQAIPHLLRATVLSRRSSETVAALAAVYAAAGEAADATLLLDELNSRAVESYVSPVVLSLVHMGLSELDEALTALEKAYTLKAADLIWINTKALFDPVRSESRFQALCRKIGFPEAKGV